MVAVNFVIPVILLGIRRFCTITGCVIASIGVVIGMWLERFLIVVPSLSLQVPAMPAGSFYVPRPTEL